MANELTFNYKQQPGQRARKNNAYHTEIVVSIITAYYNCSEYIFQTANSVLNQTFPNWEWIIVNDGSTEIHTKKILNKLKKMDSRIKIFNKENEGPAIARDYGIKFATSEYVIILDADDLIDKTFIECAYCTMLSNSKASFAYSDQVGFGNKEYLWTQKFDIERQKKENLLCICSLIKKSAILSVGGYSKTERSFHEDWKLWLALLQKGCFPVKMNYYGFWYRNREGRLKTALKNPEKRKIALDIIKKLADGINTDVKSVDYPKNEESYIKNETIKYSTFNTKKTLKKSLLFVLPTGDFDFEQEFMLNVLIKLKQKYKLLIVTTKQLEYPIRQQFEMISEVFDLTTFLDRKYWESFIDYIIHTRNINLVFCKNNNFNINTTKTIEYLHSPDRICEGYTPQILSKKIELELKPFIVKKACIIQQNIIKYLKIFLKKFRITRYILKKIRRR